MIYLLHENAEENAKMLDDRSLDKQIKAIAQTLCNVHHLYWDSIYPNQLRNHKSGLSLLGREQVEHCLEKIDNIPLQSRGLVDPDAFTNWAAECRANYLKLVEMGLACCKERVYRAISKFGHIDTLYQPAIEFARDNVLDLQEKLDRVGLPVIDTDPDYCPTTHFPLCVPEQYKQLAYKLSYPAIIDETSIIESYRNYYRAKIKKGIKTKCITCKSGTWEVAADAACPDCAGRVYYFKPFVCTRREKQEWLL
jgi:hypothetical protein